MPLLHLLAVGVLLLPVAVSVPTGSVRISRVYSDAHYEVPHTESGVLNDATHRYSVQRHLGVFVHRVCLVREPVGGVAVTDSLVVRVVPDPGMSVYSIDDVAGLVTNSSGGIGTFSSGMEQVNMTGPIVHVDAQWVDGDLSERCVSIAIESWRDDPFDYTAPLALAVTLRFSTVPGDSYGIGVWGMHPTLVLSRTVSPRHTPAIQDSLVTRTALGVNDATAIGSVMASAVDNPYIVVMIERECMPGLRAGIHSHIPTKQYTLKMSHRGKGLTPSGIPFVGTYAPTILRFVGNISGVGDAFVRHVLADVPDVSASIVASNSDGFNTHYTLSVPFSGSSCGTEGAVYLDFAWFSAVNEFYELRTEQVGAFGHDPVNTAAYGYSTLVTTFQLMDVDDTSTYDVAISDRAVPIVIRTFSSGEFRTRFSNMLELVNDTITFFVDVPYMDASSPFNRMWHGVAISDTCMSSQSGDFFTWRTGAGHCANYHSTHPDFAADLPSGPSDLSSWYFTRSGVTDLPVPSSPMYIDDGGQLYVRYQFRAQLPSLTRCANDDGSRTRALTVTNGPATVDVTIPVSVTFLEKEAVVREAACFTHTYRLSVNSTSRLFSNEIRLRRTLTAAVTNVQLEHGSVADCAYASTSGVPPAGVTPARSPGGGLPGQTGNETTVCGQQDAGTIARAVVTMKVRVPYTADEPYQYGILPTRAGGHVNGVWNAAIRPNPNIPRHCFGFNATLHSSSMFTQFVEHDAGTLENVFLVRLSTVYLPFKHVGTGDVMTDLFSRCASTEFGTGMSLYIPIYRVGSVSDPVSWASSLVTYAYDDYYGPLNEPLNFDIRLSVNPVALSPALALAPSLSASLYVLPVVNHDVRLDPVGDIGTPITITMGQSIGIEIYDARVETRNVTGVFIERAVAVMYPDTVTVPSNLFTDACSLDVAVMAAFPQSTRNVIETVDYIDRYRVVDSFTAVSEVTQGAYIESRICRHTAYSGSAIPGSDAYVCMPDMCEATTDRFSRIISRERMRGLDAVILPTTGFRPGYSFSICVVARAHLCSIANPTRRRLLSTSDDPVASYAETQTVFGGAVMPLDAATAPPPADINGTSTAPGSTGVDAWVLVVSIGVPVVLLLAAGVVWRLSPKGRPGGRYADVDRTRYGVEW